MRKRGTRLALAALLASGATTAAAVEPTPGLPPRLRVLVPADEMPEMFSFDTNGHPGFERELIEGFCRIHGLTLDVVQVKDFEQIIPMLQRGEGDVITGIVDTEARRQKVAFTSEVYPVRHMAITRRPAPAVTRLEDLRMGFGTGIRTLFYYFVLKLDVGWRTDLVDTSRPRWHFSISPEF